MKEPIKLVIAGVGGQGVVYLTNLLVEAALLADITVGSSEIHGLSQRGGTVTSSLTFGQNAYGFIDSAEADYLIGLEALESQRCIPLLHPKSKAIIDNNRILPYPVNSQNEIYPETKDLIEYLRKEISEVIFVEELPPGVANISRNIFIAGCATVLNGFPLTLAQLEDAVIRVNHKQTVDISLKVLKSGAVYIESLLKKINAGI